MRYDEPNFNESDHKLRWTAYHRCHDAYVEGLSPEDNALLEPGRNYGRCHGYHSDLTQGKEPKPDGLVSCSKLDSEKLAKAETEGKQWGKLRRDYAELRRDSEKLLSEVKEQERVGKLLRDHPNCLVPRWSPISGCYTWNTHNPRVNDRLHRVVVACLGKKAITCIVDKLKEPEPSADEVVKAAKEAAQKAKANAAKARAKQCALLREHNRCVQEGLRGWGSDRISVRSRCYDQAARKGFCWSCSSRPC